MKPEDAMNQNSPTPSEISSQDSDPTTLSPQELEELKELYSNFQDVEFYNNDPDESDSEETNPGYRYSSRYQHKYDNDSDYEEFAVEAYPKIPYFQNSYRDSEESDVETNPGDRNSKISHYQDDNVCDSEDDLTSAKSKVEAHGSDWNQLISERNELKARLAIREREIAEEQDLLKKCEDEAKNIHEEWLIAEKHIEQQRNFRQESRKEVRDLEEKIKNVEKFLKEPSCSDDHKAVLDQIEIVTKQLLEMDKLNVELENKIEKQTRKRENLELQLAEMVGVSRESNMVSNNPESSVCEPQQNPTTHIEFDKPATDSTPDKIKDSFSVASQKNLFTIGAACGRTNRKVMKNKTTPPTSNVDAPSQLLDTFKVNLPQQFCFGQLKEDVTVKVSSQAESSGNAPQEKPQKTLFTLGAPPAKVTQRRRRK